MKLSRNVLEDVFTVAVMFLGTGAFLTLVVSPRTSTPETAGAGNPVMETLWFAVYVIVAMRATREYRQILQVLRANVPLVLLVLLAILSAFWSEDPSLTIRRGIALLATTIFGVDLSIRYSIRKRLHLAGIALALGIVLSIIVEILFHGLIPSDLAYPSEWHGVFDQKNVFAKIVVLAATVFLMQVRRGLRNVIITIGIVAIAAALIGKAQSRTALVVLAAMLLLIPAFQINRKRWKAVIPIAIIGALIACCILPLTADLTSFATLLGRDATLTGRTNIWAPSLASIARQPIWGYGYNAFWGVSKEAIRIDSFIGFEVPHAHNGYLELTLELGLAGLALFLVTYIMAVWRAARYMNLDAGREAIWPLAYFSFILLFQVTESTIVAGNSIFWMLYVSTACSVTDLARYHSGAFAVKDDSGLRPESSFAVEREWV
jgi:exopolysaccharide production protein ExoQ